ncbi:MAG: nucleotidyltransferase domain-containing protein [Candidatus Sericytochromatia bacterium]|nr:nucleotidyltransferase domain-containing protein [Candidatus Sericytochromatia bacterium]
MRLTSGQVDTILTEVARVLGPEARVWLYGSRLQDSARGGDVDLLIELTARPSLPQLAGLYERLEERLGLPCDLQLRVTGEPVTAFQQFVTQQAVRLEPAA